jgi:hypothetical protein
MTISETLWCGKPVADLSRDELLEVIEWCGNEIQRLQSDRAHWQAAADPVKYLMADHG